MKSYMYEARVSPMLSIS